MNGCIELKEKTEAWKLTNKERSLLFRLAHGSKRMEKYTRKNNRKYKRQEAKEMVDECLSSDKQQN